MSSSPLLSSKVIHFCFRERYGWMLPSFHSFLPWRKARGWAPSFTSPWLAPQLPPKLIKKKSQKSIQHDHLRSRISRSTVVSFFHLHIYLSLYRQSDLVNVHINIGLFLWVLGLGFEVMGFGLEAGFGVCCLIILRNAQGMQHFDLGIQFFHGFGIWVVVCFSLRKFAIMELRLW